MKLEHFVFRSPMPASADSVFDLHCRPGAFERLSPPWESVKVLERTGGIDDGGRALAGDTESREPRFALPAR